MHCRVPVWHCRQRPEALCCVPVKRPVERYRGPLQACVFAAAFAVPVSVLYSNWAAEGFIDPLHSLQLQLQLQLYSYSLAVVTLHSSRGPPSTHTSLHPTLLSMPPQVVQSCLRDSGRSTSTCCLEAPGAAVPVTLHALAAAAQSLSA